MNSLNDKVCEYNSEPVTENFRTCQEAGGQNVSIYSCPSGCGKLSGWSFGCIWP